MELLKKKRWTSTTQSSINLGQDQRELAGSGKECACVFGMKCCTSFAVWLMSWENKKCKSKKKKKKKRIGRGWVADRGSPRCQTHDCIKDITSAQEPFGNRSGTVHFKRFHFIYIWLVIWNAFILSTGQNGEKNNVQAKRKEDGKISMIESACIEPNTLTHFPKNTSV